MPGDRHPAELRESLRRPSTVERGRHAETAVAQWLRERGASILGANVRSGRYEIDVLARQGDLVLVVEVRRRGPGSLVGALASIDRRKQRRIVAAAESLWRSRLSRLDGVRGVRFDVAAVTYGPDGSPSVEYVAGAFTA